MEVKKRSVKVEIDCNTLQRLLSNKQMGVSEVRCLDGNSKHAVWEMCLNTCQFSDPKNMP